MEKIDYKLLYILDRMSKSLTLNMDHDTIWQKQLKFAPQGKMLQMWSQEETNLFRLFMIRK